MLFKSQVFTQVSGSIGGTTFSHNNAGLYTRARTIPVNPNSTDQQTVRGNMTTLAQAWGQTLTQPQRTLWENYAALTPVTGKFGDELILSGQQMYIRCNTVGLRGSVARVDNGPALPGFTQLTAPVTTISVGAATVSVAYDNTDEWATADGGVLVVQTSRFVSPSINFLRGPLRFLLAELGAVVPPTSPATAITNAFQQFVGSAVVGQKCGMRHVAFDATGRISGVVTELVTLVA